MNERFKLSTRVLARGNWIGVAVSLLATCTTACSSTDSGSNNGAIQAGMSGNAAGTGGVAGLMSGGMGGIAGTPASGSGGVAGVPVAGSTGINGAAGASACDASSPDMDSDGTPDCQDLCPSDAAKVAPGMCGCGMTEGACLDAGVEPTPDGGALDPDLCKVVPISDALRSSYGFESFYTRTADANGIPIVSSDSPVDEALTRACFLMIDMAGARDDVRQRMLDDQIYFIMMGADEKTVDTPEFEVYGDLDQRARGLGSLPAAICAEENIMCDTSTDRWRGESICVHEYSHTVQMGAYSMAIPDFDDRLDAAYENAQATGLFENTYAISLRAEYFAEGVQDWYNTNLQSRSGSADGVHNHINTREELEEYDPMLYAILADILPAAPAYRDCYYYE